jgi:cyclophilin family peptidyl-prolyl cis-trans isomerase
MNQRPAVDQATQHLDFKNKKYQIQLNTTEGDITLDLFPDIAPEHCRSMIGLAKIGFYDGLIFHRVIDGFMIQGGCPLGNGTGNPGYKIKAEFNSTPHEPGVLSAARSSDPNSAGSQFFICLERCPHLDRQYSAFGRATKESMPVVNTIGKVKTNSGDKPLKDVKINKATVIEI